MELTSAGRTDVASFALPIGDAAAVPSGWARYPAAVATELGADVGIRGALSSSLPAEAGLSSSAALEVAIALALGAPDEPVGLASACQRAEQAATGVRSGIMDQLCICSAREQHAAIIDCASLQVEHVPMPSDVAVWVIHSGENRSLSATAYDRRRSEAEAAAELIGPLPSADASAVEAITDPRLRKRARHVRSECDRVRGFADALRSHDLVAAGKLMLQSHRSLREDHEVSSAALDTLVERLGEQQGVFGARMTGAGFGGCVVALSEPDVDLLAELNRGAVGWQVRPSVGYSVQVT